MAAVLRDIRACVFDAYGTIFDFALGGGALSRRARRQGEQRSPRSGATSSCNMPGCARCKGGMPISGKSPAMHWTTRWRRSASTTPALRQRLIELYLTLDVFPEVPAMLQRIKAPVMPRRFSRTARRRCWRRSSTMPGSAACSTPCSRSRRSASIKPHPSVYRLAIERCGVDGRAHRVPILQRLGRVRRLGLRHARRLVQPLRPAPRAAARQSRLRDPQPRRIAGAARHRLRRVHAR